jgi:hypothetical protein
MTRLKPKASNWSAVKAGRAAELRHIGEQRRIHRLGEAANISGVVKASGKMTSAPAFT